MGATARASAGGIVIADCTNERVARDAAGGVRVHDAMVRSPKTMPADGTVADLRAMFANPHVVSALLVDGPEFVGLVDREALEESAPDDQPARSLVRQDVASIEPDAPLADALTLLDERAERRLVVLDPDGRTLRGLLCLTSERDGFCQS
jgi:CBS domain-containing protein